ncbi:MAG: isopeptide-forming domain-containing fimbrial protein [Ruminococcus sp.]|nr:isopeptide-forming domain-containing fimbrial protein [Ruminococcus sp.]
MKNMKKFAAMMAALTLSACSIAPMAMTASAATITINGVSTEQAHTFEVYQVFTGDFNSETKEFTNLKWGSGVASYNDTAVTPNALVDSSIVDALGAVDADAREFAKKIVTSNTKACEDVVSVNGVATTDDLANGYYIIKDVTNLDGKDDANSAYIVQVADNQTIAIKNEKPTVDKQVLDETADAETNATSNTLSDMAGSWGESADHAINETFQFKLTATIPADKNLAAYETYELVFTDSMSSGVTFDSIEKVLVNGTAITSGYSETATDATSKAGLSWSLTIEDVKAIVNADGADVFGKSEFTVDVIYNAHLNENAIVDKADQTEGTPDNTNNNNVYLEYSNNPDHLGSGTNEKGKTPTDYVWVFTYGVDNTKYELEQKAGNQLAGAKFSLHNGSADGAKINVIWNADKNAYVLAKEGDISEGVTDVLESQNGATNKGTFNIIGLDAGTYYLVEDEAPTGYNTVAPIEIVISAEHSETNKESENVTMTLKNDSKNMVNNPVDTKTSSLPSTGGMGTTLFYLGGGAMVAVAGVFLITKKRMGRSEN